MKCSDLDDVEMLLAVELVYRVTQCWAFTEQVADQFPDVPFKVVHAKLSKLVKRGLITGCACGCRGDWEITMKGAEMANVVPARPNPMVDDYVAEKAAWKWLTT